MTATDRARFFTGEYPRKPRLRYVCHHSGRVSVIRTTYPLKPWQVVTPDGRQRHYLTFEEAVLVAQRLAKTHAERDYRERTRSMSADAVQAIVDGAQ